MKTRGWFAFWRQAVMCRRLVYAALPLLCLMAAVFFAPSAPPAPPGASASSAPAATVGSISVVARLDSFPRAAPSWGDALNPDGQVPATGFAAYYLDRSKSGRVIAREEVPHINIHYGYDDFHGIPSDQFDAYWIGRLHVPQRAVYSLFVWHVSQMTGRIRLVIDGRLVGDGLSRDLPDNLLLEAGDHVVAVEYANFWHTTNFRLNLRPSVPVMTSPDSLAPSLRALQLPADTVVFLVTATWHGNRFDNTFPLYIDDSRPYVLLVQGSGLNWEIHGTPLAIVSDSADNDFRAPGSPPVFFWETYIDMPDALFSAGNCRCQGAEIDCADEFDKMTALIERVQQWTGYPLAGVGVGDDHRAPRLRTDAASLQQKQEAFARFKAEEGGKCAAKYREETGQGMQRRFDAIMPQAAP